MNINKILKEINAFDEITRFRLLNAFLFAIGFNMLVPVLIDLKGEYLASWVIALFLVGEQLIVRTNRYVCDTFNTSQIYKLGIFTHVLLITCALLYFITPLAMIISESVLGIIDVAIFGVYSIKLNNYITERTPEIMHDFQIVRNNTWANGLLLGLIVSTLLTYFYNNGTVVLCFVVWNSLFTLWMIKNWSFYEKYVQEEIIN